MNQQVDTYLDRCEACDHVRLIFNTLSPQLKPLPLMGLGYGWSLNFASPLTNTSQSAKYIFVMVEHFGKWIELIKFPQNNYVLTRFRIYV